MKITSFVKKIMVMAAFICIGSAFAQNVVSDPSFESKVLGEWKLDGDGAACYIEQNKDNARTGKCTYKYWLNKGFESTLTREFTGLANGTYQVSIWAMGGGGEKEIRFFATDFDGAKEVAVPVTNTGWKKWKQYVMDVPVKDGKMKVGIYLNTNKDNWGNFDDIEIVLK